MQFERTSQKNLSECLDFYDEKIEESDLDTESLCYNTGNWFVPKSCKVRKIQFNKLDFQ